MSYEVRNNAATPWAGRLYGQFLRAEVPPEGGLFRTYTYTGGVISGPEKPYEKIEFSDMEKNLLERETTGGWVAMIQHYFAGAWIPDQSATNRFYSLEPDGVRYVLGLMTPGVRVQPRRLLRPPHRSLRGPEGAGEDGGGGAQPEARGGLRLAVADCATPVLAAGLDPRHRGQLGVVDHHSHPSREARVLPPFRRQLQVDGENAQGAAADHRDSRPLRRRQGADEPEDDGAVPGGEDQPPGRLSAHRGPDTGVHRAVLGAAGERGGCARPRSSSGSRT